jgi:hypothetical protein
MLPKSKGESVRFDGITWVASRPSVLQVLKNVRACSWGVLATFHGTEAELTAAGVADASFFEGIGKSGQKTHDTDSGDRYVIRRRRGQWDLEIWSYSDNDCAPSDEYPRPSPWWRKHGGEAEAEMRRILAALRQRV